MKSKLLTITLQSETWLFNPENFPWKHKNEINVSRAACTSKEQNTETEANTENKVHSGASEAHVGRWDGGDGGGSWQWRLIVMVLHINCQHMHATLKKRWHKRMVWTRLRKRKRNERVNYIIVSAKEGTKAAIRVLQTRSLLCISGSLTLSGLFPAGRLSVSGEPL